MDYSNNKKRIAKNTLFLYIRMLLLMAVNLYASRVILSALGVDDFGIYNAVGGFVALFSVISKSLSTAASRFMNYEMGRDNWEQLKSVFSTSVTIHVLLAISIAILAEAIGIWFVNIKMVIPPTRITAANWVFQFSLITFCVSLFTVPYHAAIIAHERMKVFAYISIFEGFGKLAICFLVMVSPIDKLVFYALLMLFVQLIVQLLNQLYCKKNFSECKYHFLYDKTLLKKMFGFAGWNMIGASSAVLRNQGGNILLNLFFGPSVNAARAIANQVLHAVNGFVENFFMAIRPQIMKSYASGDRAYMMSLMFQGSRYSYYILLVLCLPILTNTEYLLHLWLGVVPDHFVSFVQLTLLFTMLESVSNTLTTAVLATGKTKKYQLTVGVLNLLNIPISYVILKFGGIAETILYVAIVLSTISLFLRLYILRELMEFDVMKFMREVLLNLLLVSIVAVVLPVLASSFFSGTFLYFILTSGVCVICSIVAILYIGMDSGERLRLRIKLISVIKNKLLSHI